MDREKFKELFFKYTNKELGKKLGVSGSTITQYAKRFGLSKPLGRKKGKTKVKFIF